MHRRPKLQEAIDLLQTIAVHNEDAQTALADYFNLKQRGEEFLASRMVVDIVDHYYHLLDLKGIAHG